ncbi:putative polygalacturonase [Nymphaea thermarum]|nr:putative polygalacturonase [Nymphaea thermarum]
MKLAWVTALALRLLCVMGECKQPGAPAPATSLAHYAPSCRAHRASIKDFGGVGDGSTSNTKAFRDAVAHLSQFSAQGGALLYVPPGRWLTGGFNLTSNFTLFLDRDAVLLASQDMNEWPLIDPLPSYGRGRDAPGARYSNFIFGTNLTDVVITGNNGTIDGQGEFWWDKFHQKELKYTRGYLIEFMYTTGIVISNITLLNSPSWNVHPVYSRNIVVQGVTILAPVHSPNTDGIDPDSCSQVWIQDCYIVSGDDCIAIKSGWDEYGIRVNMPSEYIYIKGLTCISPTSAVIALGSEMSGGIQNVFAEDITTIDSEVGVRVKSAPGRGGFVKGIYVRGMTMKNMKYAFNSKGFYKDHADDDYNPKALPVVNGISLSNMVVENATMAAKMEGIQSAPYTGICISNVTISLAPRKSETPPAWNCTDVHGVSSDVSPVPCRQLSPGSQKSPCPFPLERVPIHKPKLELCT